MVGGDEENTSIEGSGGDAKGTSTMRMMGGGEGSLEGGW